MVSSTISLQNSVETQTGIVPVSLMSERRNRYSVEVNSSDARYDCSLAAIDSYLRSIQTVTREQSTLFENQQSRIGV